jgi:hypothetical protein
MVGPLIQPQENALCGAGSWGRYKRDKGGRNLCSDQVGACTAPHTPRAVWAGPLMPTWSGLFFFFSFFLFVSLFSFSLFCFQFSFFSFTIFF